MTVNKLIHSYYCFNACTLVNPKPRDLTTRRVRTQFVHTASTSLQRVRLRNLQPLRVIRERCFVLVGVVRSTTALRKYLYVILVKQLQHTIISSFDDNRRAILKQSNKIRNTICSKQVQVLIYKQYSENDASSFQSPSSRSFNPINSAEFLDQFIKSTKF